jgi:hypothetical protein
MIEEPLVTYKEVVMPDGTELTPGQLQQLTRKEAAKRRKRRKPLPRRIQELKHRAMDYLQEIIDTPTEELSSAEKRLKFDVARDVINRSGDVPIIERKQEIIAHITGVNLDEIKQLAQGQKDPWDDAVDAEEVMEITDGNRDSDKADQTSPTGHDGDNGCAADDETAETVHVEEE